MSIGGINYTVSMHVLHTVNVYKPQLFPSDTDVLIGHNTQKQVICAIVQTCSSVYG